MQVPSAFPSNRCPQSIFLVFSEADTRGVLCKKVFLEILHNSQKNSCARVSFLFIKETLAQPSKHFNISSTLFVGWYDVATCTTSNQCWKNIVYVNVEIYNVQQHWNNVVYFNVELNNVRQGRNKLSFLTSIFITLGNIETTLRIWPFERKIKPWFKNKIIFLSFKEYAGLKISFSFFPF